MKVILLAAGAGKGFETQEPKALAPVKNKPMILHITEKIRQIKKDFETIVVIKETEKEKFEHALKEKGHFGYAFQKEPIGTADALKKAVEVLEGDDDLLIMYSDTVLIREASLAGMINNHQLQSNAVTFLSGVAWSTYPYALVKREEDEVTNLLEHGRPSGDPPYEYFVGPLIAKTDAIRQVMHRIKPDPVTGEYYIPEMINLIIKEGYKVGCFKSLDESEYLGVNTKEDLIKVEDFLSRREIENLAIMEERSIRFGTGGWRARIGRGFTSINVRKVIQGISTYLIKNNLDDRGIVIGYDNRFLSEDFSKMAAEVFAANNIRVYLSKSATPTPLVTFTVLEKNAGGGIVFTASHNPPDYNGIKFETHEGLPASVEITERIQEIANETPVNMIPWVNFERALKNDYIKLEDFRNAYLDYIEKQIDIKSIRLKNPRVCFDPMYGAGTSTLQMALIGARCDLVTIHSRVDPLFGGKSPAPSEASLTTLIQFMKENKFDLGIAVDGDADRIALVDELGNYIPANDVILLVYYYLHEIKGQKGGVVRNIATSHNIDLLCEKCGELLYEVPVGFKHIANSVKAHDLLLGGESSGGVTVRGHIMEKDGIYTAMLIMEMLAKTEKSLSVILNEIYQLNGKRYYQSEGDFKLTPKLKVNMDHFMASEHETINHIKVNKIDRLDGMKLYLENDSWCLLRPSGTEPLLRIVTESTDQKLSEKLLHLMEKAIF
ncbi:MAG: NTP transferase domain-containing protein [Thermotogota bacterium]|nr:NTP transferase domain-containing protein [Thermotogota bacterium]